MARMIVEAVVSPWYANATDSPHAGAGVMLSVTHADGTPYLGLQLSNFKVQFMFDPAGPSATSTWDFEDYFSVYGAANALPGVYMFAIGGAPNWWSSHTTYTCVIAVHHGTDHGQTIVSFKIPEHSG